MSTSTSTSDSLNLAKLVGSAVTKTTERINQVLMRVDDPRSAQLIYGELERLHRGIADAMESLVPKLPQLPSEWANPYGGYVLSMAPPSLHSTSSYTIRCGECNEPSCDCECESEGGTWDEDLEEYEGGSPHVCGDDCEVYADGDGEDIEGMFDGALSDYESLLVVRVGPGAFRIPVSGEGP